MSADPADAVLRWAVRRRGPAGLFLVTRWLCGAALLSATLSLAWSIGVAQVRVEALAVVAALALGLGVLRSRFGFGPVASSPSARLVAAAGAVVVATDVMLEFRRLRVDPPLMLPMNATIGVFDPARARSDLVELTIVLGIILIGLARVTAARSAVLPSTLATAATVAAVAAGCWSAVVLAYPAAAATAGPALLLVAAAVLAAAVAVRGRADGPAAPDAARPMTGDRRQVLLAGLLATTAATGVISLLMDLLPLTGRWVGNSAPPVFDAHPPVRVAETASVVVACLLASLALAVAVRPAGRPGCTHDRTGDLDQSVT